MEMVRASKIDVLFWANLNPNERGSFEDYICHLASACKSEGIGIKLFLGEQINDSLKTLFVKNNVDAVLFPISKLVPLMSMRNLLKETNTTIVHFNFIGWGAPIILLTKWMGIKKVILTDHISTSIPIKSAENRGLPASLKRLRRQFIISKIDYFIAVSNFVADRLKERSQVPINRIKVIYNGVDLDRFKPPVDDQEKIEYKRRYFEVDSSSHVITYVGQFISEKGFEVYLECVKQLLSLHSDLLFGFVGAGPLKNRLLEFVERTKSPQIRLLGFRNDVESILKASDIVVVPSIWEEAFGLVIAEASACGVPVVGSRIGGIPEVLLDGRTGILTTPGDVSELTETILRLIRDKNLRESYSRQGRKHVEKNFDIKIQVFKTINLYQSCLCDIRGEEA